MKPLILLAALLAACGPTLTAEDRTHIANHDVTLERCKAEGREAGSYAAYDACKKDSGIQR